METEMIYRRWKTFLLAATLSAFACAAAAQTAQTPPVNQPPPRESDGSTPAKAPVGAAVVAEAPNARLAGLVRAGGTIVRNKGISSITRIGVGVYCILPVASTGITPSTAIVTLTTEYFYSQLNEIMVQWAAAGSGCPSNRIGVYTLADPNADGIYTFSNAVGFSIVVP
jgi:hypothetical protein